MAWLAALDDFRNWLIREAGVNGLLLADSPRFRDVSLRQSPVCRFSLKAQQPRQFIGT
jgi:hypothetical protein